MSVSHPLLHRPKINTRPQRPGCERRPELVKPKVILIQLGALSDGFAGVEEVELGLASTGGE
jgi:hypothetical protein